MEHLNVRFSEEVPFRIELENDNSQSFLIPKRKRMETLRFMKRYPEHVIKKGKFVWKVKGISPRLKQRGGQNNYRAYLRELKQVLKHIPHHALGKLSVIELQKQPQVKELYERYFKNNPELINHQSITNAVASNLLNYDNDTGVVRDSVADVRKKKQLPATTVPSLEITRENEFDRLLLLTFSRFLDDRRIPDLFLKSNYFTLRPQLLQVYQEDAVEFLARVEQARSTIERELERDYKALVNEMNRSYLARYPFEEMSRGLEDARGFSALKGKLSKIKQLALTVPGATQKFDGLEQLTQTYVKTPESRFINAVHVMPGLTAKMVDDSTFVQAVLKNGSQITNRVYKILEGKAMS